MLNKSIEEDTEETATSIIPAGTGLAALPKKLVDEMVVGDYVRRRKPRAQALDGQVLVVQAAELMQARKIIKWIWPHGCILHCMYMWQQSLHTN